MPLHWWCSSVRSKPFTFYDGKTEHTYGSFESFIIAMQNKHHKAHDFLGSLLRQYETRGFISDRQTSVLAEITRGTKNKDFINEHLSTKESVENPG